MLVVSQKAGPSLNASVSSSPASMNVRLSVLLFANGSAVTPSDKYGPKPTVCANTASSMSPGAASPSSGTLAVTTGPPSSKRRFSGPSVELRPLSPSPPAGGGSNERCRTRQT